MLVTIYHIFLAIIGLGILVFIHELGHYWMARRVGMRVETFSIGFGNAIWKWDRPNGERWQVGWLPIGGFVRIAGTDKDGSVDPYSIPDGFFGKSPWDRMKVAFMGPFVNFLFAILLYIVIWFAGGKFSPFILQNSYIGMLHPASELVDQGLRPGDQVTSITPPSKSDSDMIALKGHTEHDQLHLEGYRIDYRNQEYTPFSVDVASIKNMEGNKTTGILLPARTLYYQKSSRAQVNQLKNYGVELGDQLLWLDGQLLFSTHQIPKILSAELSLLTIERDGEILFKLSPRSTINDFRLDPVTREELTDWQWEANLNLTPLRNLTFIPYELTGDNYVLDRIPYLDGTEPNELFIKNSPKDLIDPLQPGDRILAVDGQAVSSADQLLEKIQQKYYSFIVQRNKGPFQVEEKKEAEAIFLEDRQLAEIEEIAMNIGSDQGATSYGSYVLIGPYSEEALLQAVQEQEGKLEDISRMGKAEKYELLSLHPLFNATSFGDALVRHNPSPEGPIIHSIKGVWLGLVSIITGQASNGQILGPVGIVSATADSFGISWLNALYWLAVISLNLAIINLLPLPVLDGGSICISLCEIVTGRRMTISMLEKLIIPFILAVLILIIWFTFNDFLRIIF